MSRKLLPSSAAAFKKRAKPILVVDSGRIAPWLADKLETLSNGRNQRPQNKRSLKPRKKALDYLAELLSSETALWTLCEFTSGTVASAKAIQIHAYIVHIDDVWSNEISFKLTPDTILSLEKMHRRALLLNDDFNPTTELNGKDLEENEPSIRAHCKFSRAINGFVYRTYIGVLTGLKADGSGELLADERKVVEELILSHFEGKPASFHAEPPAPPCPSRTSISDVHPLQRDEDNCHFSLSPKNYGGNYYYGMVDSISSQIQPLWPSELVGYQGGVPHRTLPHPFPQYGAENGDYQHFTVKSNNWSRSR